MIRCRGYVHLMFDSIPDMISFTVWNHFAICFFISLNIVYYKLCLHSMILFALYTWISFIHGTCSFQKQANNESGSNRTVPFDPEPSPLTHLAKKRVDPIGIHPVVYHFNYCVIMFSRIRGFRSQGLLGRYCGGSASCRRHWKRLRGLLLLPECSLHKSCRIHKLGSLYRS